MAMVPHYILINGQLLGIMKGKEAHISLPSGRYVLTIRSMYKFIESSATVDISEGETRHITFTDRDKVWNCLFNADLILWIIKRIMHVPEPWGTVYEIVSNGFFVIWLLRIWIIRKHYFAISQN